MLHGDISNHRSFVIGFRCEGSFIKYKRDSPLDLLSNAIFGKTHNASVNQDILSLMNYIYFDTEYTVMLVIDSKNYTNEAKRFLGDFPFNQVANIINSISEVTMMLNTGAMDYYVSDDEKDLSLVNSRYAMTSQAFNTLLRRGLKRT